MSTKGKLNYNTKHLSKGDPLPPYNGKLRVYNMRFCPYAHRAILALIAKNLDFEVINIDLVDKPKWLPTKSAFGKVPALEIEENVSIYESLVVVEYLDEVYPQRPLLPKDSVKKAFDKIIIEASSPMPSLLLKLVKSQTVDEELIKSYFKALDFIQNQLQQRGTKYLSGEEPGYVDYMIWPWFERLANYDDNRIKMDVQKHKLLLEYIDNMWQDPIIKKYALSKDVYVAFFKSHTLGRKPNYDLLYEN